MSAATLTLAEQLHHARTAANDLAEERNRLALENARLAQDYAKLVQEMVRLKQENTRLTEAYRVLWNGMRGRLHMLRVRLGDEWSRLRIFDFQEALALIASAEQVLTDAPPSSAASDNAPNRKPACAEQSDAPHIGKRFDSVPR